MKPAPRPHEATPGTGRLPVCDCRNFPPRHRPHGAEDGENPGIPAPQMRSWRSVWLTTIVLDDAPHCNEWDIACLAEAGRFSRNPMGVISGKPAVNGVSGPEQKRSLRTPSAGAA